MADGGLASRAKLQSFVRRIFQFKKKVQIFYCFEFTNVACEQVAQITSAGNANFH